MMEKSSACDITKRSTEGRYKDGIYIMFVVDKKVVSDEIVIVFLLKVSLERVCKEVGCLQGGIGLALYRLFLRR